jgi:hypothetical protein
MPTGPPKQKPECPPDGSDARRRCRLPSNVGAPEILWPVLRRRRGGRRTAITVAMAAWSMPTRTHARAEGPRHHRRTAGPTGAHPGWKWSWEYEHPFGTFGTARTKHAVVMVEGAILPADCRASEEDNRHDENSAGDDHYPRRNLVKPRRSRCVGRRRRRAGRWGLNLGLGCLGHPSIMPTCAPAINTAHVESRHAFPPAPQIGRRCLPS